MYREHAHERGLSCGGSIDNRSMAWEWVTPVATAVGSAATFPHCTTRTLRAGLVGHSEMCCTLHRRYAIFMGVTVAVWVKVYDGIALATDSATTLELLTGSHQVYNNADKIFHLHRELPIGAMTWGLGQIGPASISTVSKSLRLRLMGRDQDHADWELDENYTIEGVANRVAEMFCEHQQQTGATTWPGQLGYLVAGYSAGSDQSEVWKLEFQGSCAAPPTPTLEQSTDQHGYRAYAQPFAVERLFDGYDKRLEGALLGATNPANHPNVLQILGNQREAPVHVAMPFPDAIALAKFLVETTSGYSHFLLGPDTVGDRSK